FRSFAFPDCGEDLGELFMQFLTVLVKHISYPLRVGLLFEHKVGELVFKLTSNNPFGVILSFFFTFDVPSWWAFPFRGRWKKRSLDVSLVVPSACTGYSLEDKNEAKPDKIEHEFGKSAKNRGQGFKRIENGAKTEIFGSTRQRLSI
ncbi:hypothetical protein Tco_1426455, partial [Tanacetum coccineum]